MYHGVTSAETPRTGDETHSEDIVAEFPHLLTFAFVKVEDRAVHMVDSVVPDAVAGDQYPGWICPGGGRDKSEETS